MAGVPRLVLRSPRFRVRDSWQPVHLGGTAMTR